MNSNFGKKINFWIHDEKGLRKMSWWSSLRMRFGRHRYRFGPVFHIAVWKIALSAEDIKNEYDTFMALE